MYSICCTYVVIMHAPTRTNGKNIEQKIMSSLLKYKIGRSDEVGRCVWFFSNINVFQIFQILLKFCFVLSSVASR